MEVSMGRKEFEDRIEKHKASLKKYTAASIAAGYFKLALFLLISLTLSYMFFRKFVTAAIILCLVEGLAFVALLLYHDKINEKIKHSNKMIAINRNHLDALTVLMNDYSGVGSWLIENTLVYDDITAWSFGQTTDHAEIDSHGREERRYAKGRTASSAQVSCNETDDDDQLEMTNRNSLKFLTM